MSIAGVTDSSSGEEPCESQVTSSHGNDGSDQEMDNGEVKLASEAEKSDVEGEYYII